MQPRTGEIFENLTYDDFVNAVKVKSPLVPLTEKQFKILKPLSKRKRKKLYAGMSCPCASGKSFKKCNCKKYH
jgi:hypothetical protein